MSRILCTMPGRHGDILWALPTVRAISEAVGQPIDLLIAGEFGGLLPLLHGQAYLGEVVADSRWNAHEPTPPAVCYDPGRRQVVHLGYQRGWPQLPLPFEIAWQASQQMPAGVPPLVPQVTRQWITVDSHRAAPHDLTFGWSDCHFELKFGLTMLLSESLPSSNTRLLIAPGSRWETEGKMPIADWQDAGSLIAAGTIFVGDCSALHVLAVAIGRPCVLVEPMEARWNPIFWPLGMDGPQVRCVRGLDGRPTYDARHVADVLKETLNGRT